MDNNQVNSYISFKLGNETFAANVKNVVNILEIPPITAVPKSDSYLKGVCNLRGSILPVIDSRKKFNMSVTKFTSETVILVLNILLEDEIVQAGILVDSVNEVFEFSKDKIQNIPELGMKYNTAYMDGIIDHAGTFYMLLNLNRAFGTTELIDLKEE